MQGPLLTVHWKVFTPTPMPVIVVVGLPGVVMIPLPFTNVHVPVAG